MASGKAGARLRLTAVAVGLLWLSAPSGAAPRAQDVEQAEPLPPLDDVVQVLGKRELGDSTFERLVMRGYVCAALVAQSPEVCAPLNDFDVDAGIACRWNSIQGAYLLPQSDGQRLATACQQTIASWGEGDFVRRGKEAEFCAALSNALRTRQAGVLCGQAERFSAGGPEGTPSEQCQQMLAFLSGPEACKRVEDAAAVAICRDFALLARAARTQDPRACGDSLLCAGALKGSQTPCVKLKQQAVSEFLDSDSLAGSAADTRDEIKLRWSYGMPIAGAATGSIKDLIKKENKFRAAHGYSPLQPGERFMSTMSPEQRGAYLKSRQGSPEPGGQDSQSQ